jgi:predicted O-linked N-acetylglucosamine transferase (SPINDLY family)
MPAPEGAFEAGLRHHRAGQLAEAETLYRQALQQNASHADAWHLLGVVYTNQGRPQQALDFLHRARNLRPNDSGVFLNLGVALQALGRLTEAAELFRQAIRFRPDFPEAHNNLGNILFDLGRPAEAIPCWQKALSLQPDYPEAQANLARALQEARGSADRLNQAQQAVRLHPQDAAAHTALGDAFAALDQPEDTVAAYRAAVRLNPRNADTLRKLARALRILGRATEALSIAEEAVQLRPDDPDTLNDLGAILGVLGRVVDAEARLRQALTLRPQHAEAQHNLATVLAGRRSFGAAAGFFRQAMHLGLGEAASALARTLGRQGLLDEAAAALGQTLRRNPADTSALVALGETLSGMGRWAEAIERFQEALQLQPELFGAESCLLYCCNLDPQRGNEQLLADHRHWDEVHARVTPLGPAADHDRNPDRPLRVGYVSADLLGHVVVRFFEPILAAHDPRQVEAVCYADVLSPDGVTERLRERAHTWRPIQGLSNAAVAEQIRDDRIDLLVDLAGHTGARLGVFALRPAPVQLTYLGYPNTTGLKAIDYRLTDAVCDPPGAEAWHTEQLLRLPGLFCTYEPPPDALPVSAAPSRRSGIVTLGSTHKLAKLNDAVVELWCEVLRAIPESRLLVYRDSLRGRAAEDFRCRFARRGLGEERVLLRSAPGPRGHLAVYDEIDLLLDVFPWSGHATACEALWQGVPVLTLAGDRHASRMVASVLTALGLEDLVARSPQEYVEKARTFAADGARRESLRATLRETMRTSPLCDALAFTRGLEMAYRELWRRWVQASSVELSNVGSS